MKDDPTADASVAAPAAPMPGSAGPHVAIHRLRFCDTDALGHVNNAVFAVMLEQGRAELVRDARLPIQGAAHYIVLARMELDFVAEMTWPGDIRIETEILRLGNKSVQLRQRLLQGDVLCGKAVTVIVAVDRATRRAAPLLPEWRDALSAWVAADPAAAA